MDDIGEKCLGCLSSILTGVFSGFGFVFTLCLTVMFIMKLDIYEPLMNILKVIGIIILSLIIFLVIPKKRRILKVALPLLILITPIFYHINGIIYNNKMKNYLEIPYRGYNSVGNLESDYDCLGTDNGSDKIRENNYEMVFYPYNEGHESLYVEEVIKNNTSYKGADAFIPILIEELKYLRSYDKSENYKMRIYYFYEMIDEDTIKINLDKKVFEEKDK